MKKATQRTLLGLAIAAIASGIQAAEAPKAPVEAATFADAIKGGSAKINVRYRYEYVDQDGPLEEGRASTVRSRLTFQTQSFKGFSSLVEADNNAELFEDRYNDLTGEADRAKYAVIADPTYTELNQAYLDYAAPMNTLLRYGRQRINLDNQRFVGGVAWRQNEQTFDAFALVNQSLPDTTFTLAQITNVNTITDTNINGENHQVIHANNKSLALANVSGYGYLLDEISDTYGARLSGDAPVEALKLSYALEYATQETDNAASNEASYLLAELGLGVDVVDFKLGYEVLGSDDGAYGFQTPLATKHVFNGWADKFLITPNDGLQDMYLSVGTKVLGPALTLAYHDYSADESTENDNYGDEINFSVGQKFLENYEALFKVAQYNAEDFATDTAKVWLQLSAAF